MILKDEDTRKLLDVLNIAKTIGIGSIILDRESVRGSSDDGIFIISEHNIDQFKLTPLAVGHNGQTPSRVSVLANRFTILSEGAKLPIVELEFKEKDNGDKNVSRIKIKAGKTAMDFMCADPLLNKAKRAMKDPPMWSFDLDAESLELMTKANSSMQTGKLNFIFKNGKLYFNLNDEMGDSLKHLVTEAVTCIDPAKDSFMLNLKHKIVLPLFKLALRENKTINIKVSEIRQVLNFEINGINLYVMPEI